MHRALTVVVLATVLLPAWSALSAETSFEPSKVVAVKEQRQSRSDGTKLILVGAALIALAAAVRRIA